MSRRRDFHVSVAAESTRTNRDVERVDRSKDISKEDQIKAKLAGEFGFGSANLEMEFDKRLDANHDHTLSYDEFAHIVRKLVKMDNDEVKAVLRNLDKDGDGSIRLSEFKQWMSVHFTRSDVERVDRELHLKMPDHEYNDVTLGRAHAYQSSLASSHSEHQHGDNAFHVSVAAESTRTNRDVERVDRSKDISKEDQIKAKLAGEFGYANLAMEFDSRLDKNHDHKLSYDEFRHAVKRKVKLSDADVAVVVRHLDKDCDGNVSLAEFKQWMSVHRTRRDVEKSDRELHRRLLETGTVASGKKKKSSPAQKAKDGRDSMPHNVRVAAAVRMQSGIRGRLARNLAAETRDLATLHGLLNDAEGRENKKQEQTPAAPSTTTTTSQPRRKPRKLFRSSTVKHIRVRQGQQQQPGVNTEQQLIRRHSVSESTPVRFMRETESNAAHHLMNDADAELAHRTALLPVSTGVVAHQDGSARWLASLRSSIRVSPSPKSKRQREPFKYKNEPSFMKSTEAHKAHFSPQASLEPEDAKKKACLPVETGRVAHSITATTWLVSLRSPRQTPRASPRSMPGEGEGPPGLGLLEDMGGSSKGTSVRGQRKAKVGSRASQAEARDTKDAQDDEDPAPISKEDQVKAKLMADLGRRHLEKEFSKRLAREDEPTMSYKKFRQIVRRHLTLSNADVTSMIRSLDKNCDGAISLKEFMAWTSASTSTMGRSRGKQNGRAGSGSKKTRGVPAFMMKTKSSKARDRSRNGVTQSTTKATAKSRKRRSASAPRRRPGAKHKIDARASKESMARLRGHGTDYVHGRVNSATSPDIRHTRARVDSHASRESMARLRGHGTDYVHGRVNSATSPDIRHTRARVDSHASRESMTRLNSKEDIKVTNQPGQVTTTILQGNFGETIKIHRKPTGSVWFTTVSDQHISREETRSSSIFSQRESMLPPPPSTGENRNSSIFSQRESMLPPPPPTEENRNSSIFSQRESMLPPPPTVPSSDGTATQEKVEETKTAGESRACAYLSKEESFPRLLQVGKHPSFTARVAPSSASASAPASAPAPAPAPEAAPTPAPAKVPAPEPHKETKTSTEEEKRTFDAAVHQAVMEQRSNPAGTQVLMYAAAKKRILELIGGNDDGISTAQKAQLARELNKRDSTAVEWVNTVDNKLFGSQGQSYILV